MTEPLPDFRWLPDLALRSAGGAVLWANDESFAEKENLILPGPAGYQPATFGHRGQVYDGWETRRRREPGHDDVIVRLGVAGLIRGVVVDTSWFTGNFPPEVSVDAAQIEGYPPTASLIDHPGWTTLLARTPARGDTRNVYEVSSDQRWTHVRLRIHPDGGVARLRVHGEGVPDPRLLVGPVDLAALDNGGLVLDCSNRFYSSPQNLIFPGVARSMADGWETARRRDDANDWVRVRLAGRGGHVRLAEIDTSYFIGNCPGAAALSGLTRDGRWVKLVPRTTLVPDTRHRFLVDAAEAVHEARLDIYPDGGLSRLRLFGDLA